MIKICIIFIPKTTIRSSIKTSIIYITSFNFFIWAIIKRIYILFFLSFLSFNN